MMEIILTEGLLVYPIYMRHGGDGSVWVNTTGYKLTRNIRDNEIRPEFSRAPMIQVAWIDLMDQIKGTSLKEMDIRWFTTPVPISESEILGVAYAIGFFHESVED